MAKSWITIAGFVVAIGIIGCVADEDNDAIKSGDASSVTKGTKAPNVTFTSLEGKAVPMSSLAGKVVLIDFWGPTCPPCRQSLPFTQRLENTFNGKGLVVLAVTTEPKASVQAFLSKNHYSFSTYLDDGPIVEKFKIDAIPHTVIIDRTGHITSEEIGLTPQADTIKELGAAGLNVQGFSPKNDPTQSASSS